MVFTFYRIVIIRCVVINLYFSLRFHDYVVCVNVVCVCVCVCVCVSIPLAAAAATTATATTLLIIVILIIVKVIIIRIIIIVITHFQSSGHRDSRYLAPSNTIKQYSLCWNWEAERQTSTEIPARPRTSSSNFQWLCSRGKAVSSKHIHCRCLAYCI